jgi:hypothetical protein
VALLGPGTASGATVSTVTIAAATFSGREYSTHNRAGSTACGETQVPLSNGGESSGDLDNASGSYFAAVTLPDGATVSRLELLANDADLDTDVFAFLVRKKVTPNLSPHTSGYDVMADTHSNGAVNATLRRFSDGTVNNAVIDATRFEYLVELVDCGLPEPFAVKLTYSAP